MNSIFRLAMVLVLAIWFLCSLSSLSLGSATWDEFLDFEGALGSLWHGINTLKGLSPDLETITFNLEWFGNASRWPTFIPWLALQPFDFNQITVLDRVQLAILTNYFVANHINSILFGAAGLWLQYKILKRYSSKRVAFMGFILLLLYPAWSGNAWMNSKDIPFAFSYLLYSYSLASIYNGKASAFQDSIQGLHPAWIIRVLAIMLMVGSRFPSIVFVILTESILFAKEILGVHGRILRISINLKSRYLWQFCSVLLGISLAFLVTPQSWENPVKYAIDCIGYFSAETYYVGRKNGFFEALFEINAMVVASTPAVVLFGIIFFVFYVLFGGTGLVRFGNRKSIGNGPIGLPVLDRIVLPLPFWLQLLLPLALIAIKGDASFKLRHILFCLPILCSASAIGIERACFSGFKILRAISRPLIGLSLSVLVIEFLLLNPYQYLYVGELSRLNSSFNSAPYQLRDDWGFSARESLSSLRKQRGGNLLEKDRLILPSGYNPQIFWAYFNLVVPPSDARSVLAGLPDDMPLIASSPVQYAPSPEREYCTERLILFPRPRHVSFGCIVEQ